MFFQSGGDDAEPLFGRLVSVELIAKPTARPVFILLWRASRVTESFYKKEFNSPPALFSDYGEWEWIACKQSWFRERLRSQKTIHKEEGER